MWRVMASMARPWRRLPHDLESPNLARRLVELHVVEVVALDQVALLVGKRGHRRAHGREGLGASEGRVGWRRRVEPLAVHAVGRCGQEPERHRGRDAREVAAEPSVGLLCGRRALRGAFLGRGFAAWWPPSMARSRS